MRLLLCAFTLGPALVAGQTAPAQKDAPAVAREILDNVRQLRTLTGQLMQELDKPQPGAPAVERLAGEGAKRAGEIRKQIEDLDAFYTRMPEAQQAALRRSWSVATILNGCMESAQDSLKQGSDSRLSEVKTGAACAGRRAEQLDDVLAPFRSK